MGIMGLNGYDSGALHVPFVPNEPGLDNPASRSQQIAICGTMIDGKGLVTESKASLQTNKQTNKQTEALSPNSAFSSYCLVAIKLVQVSIFP